MENNELNIGIDIVCIPASIVIDKSNNCELGEEVRKVYYDKIAYLNNKNQQASQGRREKQTADSEKIVAACVFGAVVMFLAVLAYELLK